MGFFRSAGRPQLTERWAAPKLNKRVQILSPTQDEATLGGIIQDYDVIKTVWAGVSPLHETARVRYSSIDGLGTASHQFVFRYLALQGLDGSTAIYSLTSNHYLKLEQGSTEGRLFRVLRIVDPEENYELIRCIAEEVEEQGTGYSGSIY